MPRQAKELGALDVKRLTHPGGKLNRFVAVGGVAGLMLQLLPSGGRTWILRVKVGEKRRSIGLGGYPEVSLAQARDRAREAKERIREGVDPVEERRAARSALAAAQRRGLTFEDALEKWIEAKGVQVGNEKAVAYLRNSFATYAAAEIGRTLVHEVTTQDILRVLTPIWTSKNETARKLRMRLEAILSWAAVAGHRPHDAPNPARWKGNLAELLPKPDAVTTRVHQPTVAQEDLPAWWAALSKRSGMAAAALRLAVLCASRSGEVRGATWCEMDLDAAMWVIPAARMKMKKEHRVALSPAAVALLKSLPRAEDNPLVFWAVRGGELSDMALSKVMRDMQQAAEKAAIKAGLPAETAGWRDPKSGRPAVPHGLRSAFRDWAADRGIDHVLAELALAHDVGSEVERAYRRTDMITRRVALASSWADFLEGREGDTVVPIRAAAAG